MILNLGKIFKIVRIFVYQFSISSSKSFERKQAANERLVLWPKPFFSPSFVLFSGENLKIPLKTKCRDCYCQLDLIDGLVKLIVSRDMKGVR